MSLTIKEVSSRKELLKFIKFPNELYKGNPYYVPPLIKFELSTLLKEKNPAFHHCEARYWIAIKADKIVGRIAGIVHRKEFEEKALVRFGWIDFIDNYDISEALISVVIHWAKAKGAKGIHGPLGFTDLDFQGTLTSGFDQIATQGTIYNYPYYSNHFANMAMNPIAQWKEVRIELKDKIPDRYKKAAGIIANRKKLKVKKLKRAKHGLKYASQFFKILNETYSNLYGYYPLSHEQINYFTDLYFSFLKKEFACLIVDDQDQLVAFALSVPSISKALQKARGYLFPFGFLHLFRSFHKNDMVDFFLIAVKPSYQKSGINAMIINHLNNAFLQHGVKVICTGPMLAENHSVTNFWSRDYEEFASLERKCFIKYFKNE